MPASERSVRLFLKHQNMVKDFVLGLVRNAVEAEDIFQEVALVILQKPDIPCDDAAFAGWCRQVAKNKVLHHWRSRGRAKELASGQLLDAFEGAYAAQGDLYEQQLQRREALRHCMERLPDRDRVILDLCYAQGMSSEQIGQRLRRAAQGVRRLLVRVRARLRGCVERRAAAEGAS